MNIVIACYLLLVVSFVASWRLETNNRKLLSSYTLTQGKIKLIMMIIVTLVVLGASTYVILSQEYDEGTQKWAFGSIGTILGYWMK